MGHVGVDGCKCGWLAVTSNGRGLAWALFSKIDDLVSAFCDTERILIDIPIGLPWADAPVRPCDRLAREHLGRPRQSSVFPVPCREALAAGNLDAAKRINRKYIGRSISAQTWGIGPKIAEVDGFLRADGARGRSIREIHPEVCFWALADRKPMIHGKTTPEGCSERLKVLQHYEHRISVLLRDVLTSTLRRQVQRDDVLDAAVAFVTAEASHGALDSLSGEPSHDRADLPMEMVYLRTWRK